MKSVLFITYDFPYPANTGGKNRAYHMLKYSKGDFKKYLYSFVRADFDSKNIHELDKIGVETVDTTLRKKIKDTSNIVGVVSGKSVFKSLYFSKKIESDLMSIIKDKQIDVVHFESFYTAFYISDKIKNLGVKQIFGTENIEYKLYAKYTSQNVTPILRPLYSYQVNKIKKEETDLFKRADACLAVTDDEVELIKEYNSQTFKIENGIDIDDFKFKAPARKEARNLLFVGNFTYFPNVEAIESFYKNIFTNLPQEVKLVVIGKKVGSLSFNQDPRIETIEFIPDIQDAYRAADILISPIKIGGGTNFKVLEAMAAGVPVVAYEDRSNAIGLVDGKNVMMAKTDEEFGEKIKKLLSDLELRDKLAVSARKFVEEKYSWEIIGANLAKVWKSV